MKVAFCHGTVVVFNEKEKFHNIIFIRINFTKTENRTLYSFLPLNFFDSFVYIKVSKNLMLRNYQNYCEIQ